MHNSQDASSNLRRNGGTTRIHAGWKTARYLVIASLAFFAISRIFFFLDEQHIISRQYKKMIRARQENRNMAKLHLPPLNSEHTASLSGGHIGHDEQTEDAVLEIEEKALSEDLEASNAGEHPKVALMFLVKGDIPNEPVWRQFLENAGKLSLNVAIPKIQKLNLRKEMGRELHTPLPSLDEARYPGYKIQHGLVPPSKYRGTSYPHVKRRQLLEDTISVSVSASLDQEHSSENSTDTEVVQKETIELSSNSEEWRNSSNLGCLGEQEMIKKRAQLLLNDTRTGSEIYNRQDLFSIYVHASPGFKYPSPSLFYGLELENPTNCTNGFALHTLIIAEMKLLEAALKDERNQKFVLLSEACAPVHPPEVIFAQVMHESKSRINACLTKQNYGRLETWRWKKKMTTKFLTKEVWRKSQQWFILSRFHAELAVKDQHIKEVFKRYCWSYGKHICVSDEHYLPTLLASYGLDEQTDCLGEGTWTNWSSYGWHPKTFEAEEISPALLRTIQNKPWPPCDPTSARRSALRLFNVPTPDESDVVMLDENCTDSRVTLPSEDWLSDQAKAAPYDWTVKGGYVPLGYECPLFARKFPSEAVEATVNATLSCSGAALGPWCLHSLLSQS